MKKFILIFLLILSLNSCTTQELSSDWYPITTLVERPSAPFVSGTAVTTVFPYLYTADIDWFNTAYPPGSIPYEALRRHEVTHALRQKAAPNKTLWLQRYIVDKRFRWEEENLGHKAAIEYYIKSGWKMNPINLARILSGKIYGNMVDFKEAYEWAKKTIAEAGR